MLLNEIFMYNNNYYEVPYLAHHGILGMKWGIRRYQNRDGSLTKKGKAHRLEVEANQYDEKIESYRDKSRKNAGITVSGGDTDTIKKGSTINRVANSDEKIDSRRKYVSLTSEDRDNYQSLMEMVDADISGHMSEYTYSAKKNLRIASGKKVCDDLVSKYGDKNIKELHELLKDSYGFEDAESNRTEIQDFMSNTIKTYGNEILSDYKSQHYDGFVDAEDWVGGFAEYPVVLIDPKTSLKFKSENKRW